MRSWTPICATRIAISTTRSSIRCRIWAGMARKIRAMAAAAVMVMVMAAPTAPAVPTPAGMDMAAMAPANFLGCSAIGAVRRRNRPSGRSIMRRRRASRRWNARGRMRRRSIRRSGIRPQSMAGTRWTTRRSMPSCAETGAGSGWRSTTRCRMRRRKTGWPWMRRRSRWRRTRTGRSQTSARRASLQRRIRCSKFRRRICSSWCRSSSGRRNITYRRRNFRRRCGSGKMSSRCRSGR